MLVQLLEAALRSFALGGVVCLSLRFLRVHNPQARMTAWTLVLMASLSMPVVMHWATVTIPAYSPPPDVAVAPVSPPSTTPATVQPSESLTAKISRPPAAANDSISAYPHEASSVDSSLAAIDWPSLAMGLYLAVAVSFLLRLAIGLALTCKHDVPCIGASALGSVFRKFRHRFHGAGA
jgi:hypothetical protein